MEQQDVITIPTVLYSNHLNLPTVGGGVVPASLFSDLLEGVLKLNILNQVSTIITGYMGSSEQVKITANFVVAVKKTHPDITYLCDPVMGDMGRNLYVAQDVPQALIAHLMPLADILTPNQFEFEQIVGKPIGSVEDLTQLFQQHPILPHQQFVVTGCQLQSTPAQMLENLVAENGKLNIVSIGQINVNPPGTGELFTAHLHLLLLRSIALNDAVALSARILKAVLQKMAEEGRCEFSLEDIMFSIRVKNEIVKVFNREA